MIPSSVSVLMVDDVPDNLLVLEELLRHPGRRLVRAGSGNEALRLMLKQEFALVLLDVQMPGMDGYETAELMRGAESTRSIPIIFMTAGDRSDEAAFRGYDVGAVDFLYKPINPQLLLNKVEVFVELHRRNLELCALNAALERATDALHEKVADLESVNQTISHDLRAPLRSIVGFTEILAESLEGRLDDETAGHFRRIVAAGERMGRMLDDLYRLLRLSAAEQVFPPTECGAVFRGVVDDLRGDIESSGAEVTSDALPTLRANPVLLAQIFQNLFANAIKFRGGEHPRVHVTAEAQPSGWQIGVRDNGIGIPPAARERVFGLFDRVGETLPGTGVGLALCKRAVEKHGGRIWVESGPSGGSTFYFTIPARE
ncbi:MAG TPA: ATP-binding protein [Kofleriaceae bacterium]|nr:ATP-binding protein [Kofleriaceae bacterium]